jgi:hypothetical protein
VVAWILGEYGAGLPDAAKKGKILNLLVQVAYRPLEDELTRGYILSAVTKLHQSMGFPQEGFECVGVAMYDYSKSKHVDVQQRALEYKVLKESAGRYSADILMRTPLNDS